VAFDEYWEMIRFWEQSHLISFVVGAHALHHSRRGTINFHALSNELDGTASSAIASGTAIHKKVEVLRHQAFAHRTDKKTYNDVFTAAGILGDEILSHAALTLGIANELLRAAGLGEVSIHNLPEQTLDRMLTELDGLEPI
jgi:hypothetical protein